ncbi:MAG: integrase arm-type DNA-binding domain-containing protein [Hyphomonadaceae bacterium]|nr:integrase arm-type DNA-binding domain-containing protein [Hyphomonadaceae bacterium]
MAITKAKTPGMLHDGGGLYLQITRGVDGSPRKSWVLRLRLLSGRMREMGLGSAMDVGLSEARIAAEAARKHAREGRDPIEVRELARRDAQRAELPVQTFKQCVEDFMKANKGTWRTERYERQWKAPLERYAYPVIGPSPVSEIDITLIRRSSSSLRGDPRQVHGACRPMRHRLGRDD